MDTLWGSKPKNQIRVIKLKFFIIVSVTNIVKELYNNIRIDSIELLQLKVEEKELINNIKERKQNTVVTIVKLGRNQILIQHIERDIRSTKVYIKHCLDNFVIC